MRKVYRALSNKSLLTSTNITLEARIHKDRYKMATTGFYTHEQGLTSHESARSNRCGGWVKMYSIMLLDRGP